MDKLFDNVRGKIREIRQQRGYTTFDLAEITRISQSTISKIENGKRKIDLDTLEIICKGLHVKIQKLFRM